MRPPIVASSISVISVRYGCSPDGTTQQLLNLLGRHGRRPAHIHFFVSAPQHRKLTTQINIDSDEYLWDDFAFASRERLVPPITRLTDPARIDAKRLDKPFASIDFDFHMYRDTESVPTTLVDRPRTAAWGAAMIPIVSVIAAKPTNFKPKRLDDYLVEDAASGQYRLHRNAFTDPALFELEMQHIFEGNWIYLVHESQVANVNDYYTTQIGRQPVFIARNRNGELNAFINACSHRGAQLCRHKRGNKATDTCPFHGWTFKNSGKLLKVKDPADAGYPECFTKEGSHDLKKLARFASYKGFLFGSLNPDVAPLDSFLGEAGKIIDMIVDQSPEGLEVLRGSSTGTCEGNWKLQAENGADGYHVTAVHWNFAATTSHRKKDHAAREDKIRAMDAGNWGRQGGGFYAFENGHMLLWSQWANPEDRPNHARHAEYAEQHGAAMADWMVGRSRNLCLYPNVYLMDQFSSQIRVLRPLAVNKTEVTIYCIAPKGESAEARAHRIRQYEDFFNVSGMATPDGLEEFRACQQGYNGSGMEWNDMCRGAAHRVQGADHAAKDIGLAPVMSGVRTEDEGQYTVQHRYWLDVMMKGFAQEQAAQGRSK